MALFELLPKLRMNCRTVTWNTRFREHLKTSHSGNVIRFEGIIVNTLLFGSSRPTLYTFLDFYLFPGFWLPCTNWQETGWYKENENGFLLPWIPHLSCPVPYSTGTWVSRPFSFFRPQCSNRCHLCSLSRFCPIPMVPLRSAHTLMKSFLIKRTSNCQLGAICFHMG